MAETKIYGLVDPRNPDLVMYVGKTKRELGFRLNGHIHLARRNDRLNKLLTACQWWILQLLRDGIRPEIVLLLVAVDNWQACEKQFVAKYREVNPSLLNVLSGGGGDPAEWRKICLKHKVRRDRSGCWVCNRNAKKLRYRERSRVAEQRALLPNEIASVHIAWKNIDLVSQDRNGEKLVKSASRRQPLKQLTA